MCMPAQASRLRGQRPDAQPIRPFAVRTAFNHMCTPWILPESIIYPITDEQLSKAPGIFHKHSHVHMV